MSYEALILAFLILFFCFATTVFVVKVMVSVFNSAKEGKEIKFPEFFEHKPEKPKMTEAERKLKIISENLEAYDGTEIGQKEVK